MTPAPFCPENVGTAKTMEYEEGCGVGKKNSNAELAS
jgi:hypothetical protein